MKKYTYNSSEGNFEQWVAQHSDCEVLTLKGSIEIEDIAEFEKVLNNLKLREIDISEFSAIERKRFELLNYSLDIIGEDGTPSLLQRILLNKEFADNLIIEKDNVFSHDRHVIIACNQHDSIVLPQETEIIGHLAFVNNILEEITLPQGLKQIGDYAFYYCENLTRIEIPDSVKQLGEGTFKGCDIEHVKLSNNLCEIPASCFEYNGIETIDFPPSVKRIHGDAFHCNYIEKVILPEGVEYIGWNVFTHQNKYISFPSTMKEIEKDFFYEECIDTPEDCIPYIDVNENNPLFFSKDGTLYRRDNPNEPYLGYKYKYDLHKRLIMGR